MAYRQTDKRPAPKGSVARAVMLRPSCSAGQLGTCLGETGAQLLIPSWLQDWVPSTELGSRSVRLDPDPDQCQPSEPSAPSGSPPAASAATVGGLERERGGWAQQHRETLVLADIALAHGWRHEPSGDQAWPAKRWWEEQQWRIGDGSSTFRGTGAAVTWHTVPSAGVMRPYAP